MIANPDHVQEIVDYYDHSLLDYQIYNQRLTNLSMHFGMWDATTKTHRQALENENRVLAGLAGILPSHRVLDLGCGYGATAVWLAKHIGCSVVGITLSRKQVDTAHRLAASRGVGGLTTFRKMDFHALGVDGPFDVVLFIESLCHSVDKPMALSEAFRVLRPGGLLVVADGYLGKEQCELTLEEEGWAKTCFDGVHIPPLGTPGQFETVLLGAGFRDIWWSDQTAAILPTSRRIHRLVKWSLLPLSRVLGLFRLPFLKTAHMLAFTNQYHAFRHGLGVYGVFLAQRPHHTPFSR